MHTQILIVGGGPVGLALAIELGIRGIRCVVVEQNEPQGALQAPRSKMINVRVMTHFRRWGLAQAIREAVPEPLRCPSNIIYATRLLGPEIVRFENAFNTNRDGDGRFPEGAAWLPQYLIENVMRAHVARLPTVKLLLSTRLESFVDTANFVEAMVRNGTVSSTLRADYIVGADGFRSTVRTLAGIEMQETQDSVAGAPNVNALVRAPGLLQKCKLGPAAIYHLLNDEAVAGMGPFDEDDRWFINAHPPYSGSDVSDIDLVRYAQAAIGAPMPIEILCRSTWSPRAMLAEKYRLGRVLLAGDAAQIRPPTGGYGMNLGICDAVDLGWKTAATLQGWGGPLLLDTYEIERRMEHLRIHREALENYSFVDALRSARIEMKDLELPGVEGKFARSKIGNIIKTLKAREYHSLGAVLGERYLGSPIIGFDPEPPPAESFSDYTPSTVPGCLAPHAWLADGRSLYDLFGQGFTLLVRYACHMDEAAKISAASPLALTTVLLDAASTELYPQAFTLIRPDQHVAWRGNRAPSRPQALLDQLRGTAT